MDDSGELPGKKSGKASVFISYRRSDSKEFVLLLYEYLKFYIDKEIIFYDRDCIETGKYFPEVIRDNLETCRVFLVVIGTTWSSDENLKRLHNEDDFVRKEIERALDRQQNESHDPPCIIPVLYDNDLMPDSAALPDSLKLLSAIQTNIKFTCAPDAVKEQIRPLCELIWKHTLCSWASQHNSWFKSGLASDKITSKDCFSQQLTVLNADSKYVERKAAVASLNDWWDSWHEHHVPFVMTGEEGDGKSWAAAAWVADRVATEESTVPVIFIPSINFTDPGDCISAMATVLRKACTVVQPDWEDRIRFLTNTSKRDNPLILMVVDGLNEAPSQDWRCLFDAVLSTGEGVKLRDSIAVIVTCRTQYWTRSEFVEYHKRVKSFTLLRYNEEELMAALKLRNITDAFSPSVREFLFKPRYLDMAVELRPALDASGADLTVELLIYEDWRHRVSQKQKRGLMSTDEFHDFITSIAKNYDGKVTQRELLDELDGLGNLKEVREELLTSGIFVKQCGKFKVSINPMVLGFGLLLANDVEENSNEPTEKLDELIVSYIGRHDNDIHGQICAMALFHALRVEDYPENGQLALFRAWVHGHNSFQTDEDVERIYNNFAGHPEIYLRFAEELWSSHSNHRLAQNIFMASFLGHCQHRNVQEAMVEAFRKWYGIVYSSGYRGLFEQDQHKIEELTKEVKKRLGDSNNLYGCALTITDNKMQLRLAQAAESVISHMQQELFWQALVNGTISTVVMDGSNVDFRWVVRTASKKLHCHLLEKSCELIGIEEETAQRAAYRLLSWVCNEEALALRDKISEEHGFNNAWRKELLKEDKCNSIMVLWSEDDYLDCMQRTQLASITIAANLNWIAINPLCQLPEDLAAKIDTTLDYIDLTQIRSHLGQTREDVDIEKVESALCAYKPERYAELYKKLSQQLDGRDYMSCRLLAYKLYEQLPILTDVERELILKAWRLALTGEGDEAVNAEIALFPMVIYDRSADEQLSLLVERGNKKLYSLRREAQYREMDQTQISAVVESIARCAVSSPEECIELLWYLSKTLNKMDEKLRPSLLSLLPSNDTIIRYLCLELICNTDDQQAAQAVIASDWKYNEANCDYENGWGSVLLARFATGLSFSELADRISLQWLGYAVKERGSKAEEVKKYVTLLHTKWLMTAEPSDSVEDVLRHVKISMNSNVSGYDEDISIDINDNAGLKLVNYTWGGTAGMVSGADFKKSFDPKVAEEEWGKVYKQVMDVYKAEKNRGNHWIDTSFSNGNLDAVVASGDTCWREWITPVLEENLQGRRLLTFCQGLYESLCATLLNHEPETGATLFKTIMKHKTTRIVDSATDIQHLLFSLFEADETPPVRALWDSHLDDCDSDKDLSEMAYLAQSRGKTDWLDGVIQSWLISELDYDKARALRLLGFSKEVKHGEQLQDWVDTHGRSWLMDVAKNALTSSKRNAWARSWIERFVVEEDRVKSWAAFRLFLRCVDKRFWIWGQNLIKLDELPPWKKDAYRGNVGTIMEAIKENEKKLKDTFIGHEVKENQLWPWMKRYVCQD